MRSLNRLIPLVGRVHQPAPQVSAYRVIDRLHEGRAARVSVDGIAATVGAWLAELGVSSPMVEELAKAVRSGDWPAAHAIAEHLSIDVAVAA
ncbi:hypothetical protein [Mycolicibacterium stellerae]|uniref:hypothetical protein n=1 Tax=Mycolicibacterium stellerae TaxID=2358193 RepID=UPI002E10659D